VKCEAVLSLPGDRGWGVTGIRGEDCQAEAGMALSPFGDSDSFY